MVDFNFRNTTETVNEFQILPGLEGLVPLNPTKLSG